MHAFIPKRYLWAYGLFYVPDDLKGFYNTNGLYSIASNNKSFQHFFFKWSCHCFKVSVTKCPWLQPPQGLNISDISWSLTYTAVNVKSCHKRFRPTDTRWKLTFIKKSLCIQRPLSHWLSLWPQQPQWPQPAMILSLGLQYCNYYTWKRTSFWFQGSQYLYCLWPLNLNLNSIPKSIAIANNA